MLRAMFTSVCLFMSSHRFSTSSTSLDVDACYTMEFVVAAQIGRVFLLEWFRITKKREVSFVVDAAICLYSSDVQ